MNRNVSKKIFMILLLISTLFMSIGYASVNSIILNITGELSYTAQEGVYISNIRYVSSTSSDQNDSTIKADFGTLINNTIILSNTEKDSQITYEIVVYNSTNDIYAFNEMLYSTDEFFYDNTDIKVSISGIEKWDEIDPGQTTSFLLTFEYIDGLTTITDNELNSTINFKFDKYYTITYEDVTNNNYPSKVFEGSDITITFTDPIPLGVIVSGSESYSYTSPTLTITNVQENVTIKSDVVYALDTYTFNGTSDYIDTGLMLFSEENINRDFEISFTIEDYGSNTDYATLINAMDETGSPWPGFVFRFENDGSGLNLFTVANGNGNSNKGFYGTSVSTILVQRIDNVLYYKFDDGEVETFFDFTGMTTTFDVPLTIGASLDGTGTPFRYFQGTLSNITVRFLE